MAVLIEFIAGSSLAIFFHLVLRSPEVAYNVEKFLRFYELIEHSSHIIAVKNDQIIIASSLLNV